ncbi:hypothetical protein A9Q99_21195 [Gammaproteobacteria bacterium 45_16_T64]|nr:hypothetical protein A9Q99_21195 [Gammaproteobacteria bacterium 45_16_T64]
MKTSSPTQRTVLASTINSLVQAASKLGADATTLLSHTSIDPTNLAEADNRLPVSEFYRLYELAEQATNTPDIGLYAGRVAFVNRLNLQLYMSTICNDFREYLNLMPSALAFIGDLGEVTIHHEPPLIRLDWLPLDSDTNKQRYLADTFLGLATTIANTLCIRPIMVKKACFTYPAPSDLLMLQSIFGNNLTFNCPTNCLYFERSALDYPVSQLDNELNDAFTAPLPTFLGNNNVEDIFLSDLRQAISRLLPMGDMGIDTVAKELNVSRRTLQRRLSDRDTQFLQILQDIRVELAERYLSDKYLNITDIAFLLGYSSQGTFSSAFKTWRGCSPRDFRAQ